MKNQSLHARIFEILFEFYLLVYLGIVTYVFLIFISYKFEIFIYFYILNKNIIKILLLRHRVQDLVIKNV